LKVTIRLLADVSADVAAQAQNRGFEHYFVAVNLGAGAFTRRVTAEQVDPQASWIYETDAGPAGIVLVARRGRTSRIAALGLAPALRGRGLGREAMQQAIVQARERGDERLVLEVISTNEAALALYDGLGFERVRKLVGYRRPPDKVEGTPMAPALQEVVPSQAARRLQAWSDADLPWQLAPQTHAAAAPPLRGFVVDDDATALVDDTGADLRIVSMAVRPDARRRGLGRRLVAGLLDAFDGRALAIPPIVPEHAHDAFMAATGWHRTTLAQHEMSLTL
jgi:ribosomal protein S18 acetylase RimI-like enzyme